MQCFGAQTPQKSGSCQPAKHEEVRALLNEVRNKALKLFNQIAKRIKLIAEAR